MGNHNFGLGKTYRIGFILGLALATVILFPGYFEIFKANLSVDINHTTFFIYSIAHLSLLGFAGFAIPSEQTGSAGLRIQTGGYLYALVGFGVSLNTFSEGAAISTLIPGLVSSLISSVLGWFIGGEVAMRGSASEAAIRLEQADDAHHILSNHENALAECLANLTRANSTLIVSLNSAEVALTRQVGLLEGSTKRLATAVINVTDSIAPLGAKLNLDSAGLASESLATLGAELASVTARVRETGQYFRESSQLMKQLEGLLEAITREGLQRGDLVTKLVEAVRLAVDPLVSQLASLEQELSRRNLS